METLARENAEPKDRLLRTLAEMENLRRAPSAKSLTSRHYSIASFARDILAVADNMDRALGALDAELRETANAGRQVAARRRGTHRARADNALEKHEVTKFEPQKGERFDPNLHQAMYKVPDPSLSVGTIAQIVQPGYMIGERMLRPALVAVAKGGPKLAPAEAAANDNPDSNLAKRVD